MGTRATDFHEISIKNKTEVSTDRNGNRPLSLNGVFTLPYTDKNGLDRIMFVLHRDRYQHGFQLGSAPILIVLVSVLGFVVDVEQCECTVSMARIDCF